MAKPIEPVIPGYEPGPGDNCEKTTFGSHSPVVMPLPVLRFKDQQASVLSRWKLTPEEIEQVGKTGDIYVWTQTYGYPLQPFALDFNAPQVCRHEEASTQSPTYAVELCEDAPGEDAPGEDADTAVLDALPSEVEKQLMCAHEAFTAEPAVMRVNQHGRVLRMKVNCQQCGLPFSFKGVPSAPAPEGASISSDGLEIYLPLAPGERNPHVSK